MARLKKYVQKKVRRIKAPAEISRYEKAAGLVACFKTYKEAIETVEKETGGKVEHSKLVAFIQTRKGKEIVGKVRERYLRALTEVPIANKRVRLDRLEEEYKTVEEAAVRVKILEQARKEIEGFLIVL